MKATLSNLLANQEYDLFRTLSPFNKNPISINDTIKIIFTPSELYGFGLHFMVMYFDKNLIIHGESIRIRVLYVN